MNDEKALEIVNKIYMQVFAQSRNLDLDELLDKYAFDVKLPKQVHDSITNEITWADSINSKIFITQKNMEQRDITVGWMQEKKSLNSLQDIIDNWNKINYTTTERIYDSINVCKSDTIYYSENVYHCTDCSESKNIIYCDTCGNSEYLLACQRTSTSSYCIRTDDSKNCSNCVNVIYSNKIANSFFIQDCYDLYECMFCAHIVSKKFCIANMQFTEEEYYAIKEKIIDWLLM